MQRANITRYVKHKRLAVPQNLLLSPILGWMGHCPEDVPLKSDGDDTAKK
jgi:hypothetical protein